MLLRINVNLLSFVAVILIVAAAAIYIVFFSGLFNSPAQQQLPQDVQYALEYFNAVNSNKTILVPAMYYNLAKEYAINGNTVIENETEYANILLKNASYPGVDYVLIDMAQLNYLDELYKNAGLALSYNIIEFPVNYTVENLTSDARNCIDFVNSTRGFAQCQLYIGNLKYGPISLVTFPGNNALYTVKGAVFYNGNVYAKENSTYLMSDVSSNSTHYKKGIMFVYENIATFYIPSELMSTFYGTEMFLPPPFSKNVTDSYGEARVIGLK